jgi:hypothetical protein
MDSANTFATISNVGFGVAIVGVAVGVYGLVTSKPRGGDAGVPFVRARTTAVRLEPRISPRFAGVFASF